MDSAPHNDATGSPTHGALVSVVIPCFNQAAFLREAIDSVIAQSYAPIEIVVVDDGSTDDTSKIAASYREVRLVRQANAGLPAARNAGVRASSGEFVICLDADDRLLPDGVAVGVRALREAPEAAFAFGTFRWIDAAGYPTAMPGNLVVHGNAYEAMLRQSIPMHASAVFRRRALDSVGGYDERLPACEDFDLYLRLTRLHTVRQHDGVVAEYRQHASNMSRDKGLVIDAALTALGRQWPHVRGDARLRDAFDAGVRFWVTAYANHTVWPAAEGYWLRGGRLSLRGMLSLLRRVPHWFVRRTVQRWRHSARNAVKLLRTGGSPQARRHRAAAAATAPRPTVPPVGHVDFGSLRHVAPVDRDFGFARGWPIDRYYIDEFLRSHAADVRGRVLEIKDSSYTRRFGGSRVTHADVLDVSEGNRMATLVADLSEGSGLPSAAFDCIILTQTLQLIFDVDAALRTAHRMLKPGGSVLATVPGISKVDASIPWFWSFTEASARRLFERAFPGSQVEVLSYGNVLAAISFLEGIAVDELTPGELEVRDPEYPVCVAIRAVKSGFLAAQ